MKTNIDEPLSNRYDFKYSITNIFIAIIVLLSTFTIILPPQIIADGGGIPFFSEFSIYEPGQKAIIAWDGDEEIMILSVDVYGSEDNKILHLVPLPSLPTVKLGNVSAFLEINKLIDDHEHYNDGEGESESEGENDTEIVLHEIIGPHDLTVVRMNNSAEFTSWVTNFLTTQGVSNITFPDNTENVVKHYLNQDINYFVFDVIEVNTTKLSIEPIIYRFKSDYLYYPLVISSIIEGVSEINVVTLTPAELPINVEDFANIGFNRHIGFGITHIELEDISTEIAELIQTDTYLNFFKDLFPLKDLKLDVKCKVLDNVNWLKTVNDMDLNPVNYDCNGDDIEDIIVYSKPSYEIVHEAVRSKMKTPPNFYAINSINGDILWTHNLSLNYYKTDFWVDYVDTKLLDINNDGIMEVLSFLNIHLRQDDNYYGNIDYVFHRIIAIDTKNGNTIWIYNTSHDDDYEYFYRLSKISDVDSDNKLEILIYSTCEKWQSSYGWSSVQAINIEDGTELWNSSIGADCDHLYDLIVFDINQDLKQEVIFRNQEMVVCLKGKTGEIIWYKDIYENDYSYSSDYNLLESIHDFDLDGKFDIFFALGDQGLYLLNGSDGSVIWFTYIPFSDYNYRRNIAGNNGWSNGESLAYCDIESDGILEVLYFWKNGIHVFHANNGTLVWGNEEISPPVIFGEYYWFYHYYDKWKFEICDADQDNNLEIVCYYHDRLFVLNIENGTILWNTTLEFEDDYSWLDVLFIKDIDNDRMVEIIYSVDNNIYALNGDDGTIIWQILNSKELNIVSPLEDFDNDGSLEFLIYSNYELRLLSCMNGSVLWLFHTKGYGYMVYGGMDDIDYDGISELIIYDKIRMYVLNPATGGRIWFFTTGNRVNDYYNYNSDSKLKQNIIIFCGDKIYSVNKLQMYFGIAVNPVSVRPNELVDFTLYVGVGYSDNPVYGVEFTLSDDGLGGYFTEVSELYPGVYEFHYTVPVVKQSTINITVTAHHSKYYGKTVVVQLYIIDKNIKSPKSPNNLEPGKDLLMINAGAHPDSLKPGESSTILFEVIRNNKFITSNLSFILSDNNASGKFSAIEQYYDSHYFKFIYTVPDNTHLNKIALCILVSHEDYYAGIGIILLNITTDQPEFNNQSIEEDEKLEYEKLTFDTTPYPDRLSPGDRTVIMVYISGGEIPITSVRFQVFDNGLGGSISNFMEYGGGHYSFIYTAPTELPDSRTSVTLFIYFTHENFSGLYNLLELPIDHIIHDESENNIFSFEVYAEPNRVFKNETITIVIRITDNSDSIPFSELVIGFSDDELNGKFLLLDSFENGIFVYLYEVPPTLKNSIEISAVIYHNVEELGRENIKLKLIEDQVVKEEGPVQKSSNDLNIIGFISILFLIFIVGILIGTFGLFVYSSRKEIKHKNKNLKGENNNNKNETSEILGNVIKNEILQKEISNSELNKNNQEKMNINQKTENK